MTVTPVSRRTRPTAKESGSEDQVGKCARPACREEFRRTITAGRPNRYCGDDCRQRARTERRSAEAMVRHAEDLLRQARADLDVFDADDADAELGSDVTLRAKIALGSATSALRYIKERDGAGVPELAELVAAVTPLLVGGNVGTASVA